MEGDLSIVCMPINSTKQIFQTASATRWQSFRWGSRTILFILFIGVVVVTIALWRGYTPALPQLKSQVYKKILTDTTNRNSQIAKEYGGFRKFINDKEANTKGCFFPYPSQTVQYPSFTTFQTDNSFNSFTKFPSGIRAGFYVEWDPQSFYSLRRNITKMNLIIPEWFFIDSVTDTLYKNVDQRALDVMKTAGVKIMPVLSNNSNGESIHRILADQAKKDRLISDVLSELERNNFVGVNVDLEELKETTDEPLVNFQKELYERLHEKGFLVTQDVIPFNNDYNYKSLVQYNDYIFVMAYDQFSQNTSPGPICDQKWIEAAVDDAAKKIPLDKIILGLAAYGYDWPQGSAALDPALTYQQALITARESDAKIDFNNNTYNLYFRYYDDNDVLHDVYFTDAATSFNAMRFATQYGLSGVALWRLGSEDSRVWDFYNKDMRRSALQDFDFKEFTSVESTDDVDYIGMGEVLDVLATPKNGKITPELDTAEMLISEETYDSLPSMFVVQKFGYDSIKKICLTFDDGPDPVYTPQILDILGREHVPATFFLVGINAENNIPIVKRIYQEGHEIGDHTFTHPNIAEVSRKRAILEMESTRLLIECITGHSTIMFRAPYNADFEPEKMEELIPIAIARTKNYLDIGESIDPEDWEPGVSADTIFQRVVRIKSAVDAASSDGKGGNIFLLHDAGGETREATVKALPKIIKYFRDSGYQFISIADLLHKKKDDLMPPVPRGSGYYLLQLNYYLAEAGYWGGHILFSMFIVFIILAVSRILFLAIIATKKYLEDRKLVFSPFWLMPGASPPLVSIIVPAYNEEVNAVGSIQSLLKCDYPNFQIIFVDDGSTDQTYSKVKTAFSSNPAVQVFTKPNGGKASALNFGIQKSPADYAICIDADTKLYPNAVSLLMQHFSNEKVGAVAGNVKVGNQVNLLTKWQAIEYISSQNFDRKAFSYLNAITVVPGAIGAFRKKAIEEAGGFTTDTLAEDCDLTIRILRCGYIIENENKAIAMTEAPETLRMFIKQRFRWSFGVMQTFWKNRDTLFNWEYKWLGWIAMPNILIFQYIIPFVIPMADFFMFLGLLTGNAAKIGWYYLVFMLVDVGVALLAFSFEKEKKSMLIWLIPQRLIWRWLMWYVLFKSFRRAIKGELQNWGVLKRTGNVKEPAVAII
jgi:peptidoglycan-N-acetylglucosamine deacetylase